MDPALHELMREGSEDDEVAVLVRLEPGPIPQGMRVISRIGDIASVRIRRGEISAVRDAAEVASMKAPRLYAPDLWETQDETVEIDVTTEDVRRPPGIAETGEGVVFGFIDWGLDIAHPAFLNEDGTTRVVGFWDQRPRPDGATNTDYGYGWFHSQQAIKPLLNFKWVVS